MINKNIAEESILKVGSVFSVEGRTIKILVDKKKNTSNLFYQGEVIKNISVGGYIKIAKGFIRIICKIEGEHIKENKILSTKDYKNKDDLLDRILEVKLLGYFEGQKFKRGIKELPLLDNECFLLNRNEFKDVHCFVDKDDKPLQIGRLTFERGQEIYVGINSLLASHIGIFGNTGSGKSYTLAKLYRQVITQFEASSNFNKYAHFLIFDFNGEYSSENAIVKLKKVYCLSTRLENGGDKLPISENDLLDLQLLSILGNATEKTQKPFLKRTIAFYKKIFSSEDPESYLQNILRNRIKDVLKMSDKIKTYLLLDYIKALLPTELNEDSLEKSFIEDLDWNNTNSHWMLKGGQCHEITYIEIEETDLYRQVNNYACKSDLLSNIIDFLYLQLIHDVLSNRAQNEHIAPVINKLKSAQKDIKKLLSFSSNNNNFWDEYNCVVVNLNDVNLDMKKIIPLLLSKNIYEEQKKLRQTDEAYYLNIIIDEAHNILSSQSFREAESWKDYRLETFEEIIKEGRKFGVFLTVASQRPADISPTIISQLHNFFLHRLINDHDINAIARNISYLDKASVEYLSILPTGTCIFSGISSQVPVIIDIDPIKKENEPDNKTINLLKHWIDPTDIFEDIDPEDFYESMDE